MMTVLAKCTRDCFLCSLSGRFNENSESKCIWHVYSLERLSFYLYMQLIFILKFITLSKVS